MRASETLSKKTLWRSDVTFDARQTLSGADIFLFLCAMQNAMTKWLEFAGNKKTGRAVAARDIKAVI